MPCRDVIRRALTVTSRAPVRYCAARALYDEITEEWLNWGNGCESDLPKKRNHLAVPLTIGEVHTGLLLTSTAVSADAAAELLAIVPGGSVRTRQRPIRYALSPEVLTGVDCSAPLVERRD